MVCGNFAWQYSYIILDNNNIQFEHPFVGVEVRDRVFRTWDYHCYDENQKIHKKKICLLSFCRDKSNGVTSDVCEFSVFWLFCVQ